MDEEQRFLEKIAIVVEELQSFMTQKINQNIIYAIIHIKKAARRKRGQSYGSVDNKSQASQSQKTHSSKKSEIQSKSIAESRGRQSHASFDIINGAQTFNQIRRKAIKQKNYTQTFQNQHQYLSANQKQTHRFSNPIPHKFDDNQNAITLPKLVGLVSSQQISDVERLSANNSRKKQTSSFKNYEHSIGIEEVDEDDQFEDIVLNRLQMIEKKVSRMLRQKRAAKININQPQRSHPDKFFSNGIKLQNVGSGANIIYSNQLKSPQLYKRNEHKYNKSTVIMSTRVYTFENIKNTPLQPSTQKIYNTIKPHLTERINNPYSKISDKNNLTDNEQYTKNIVRRGQRIKLEHQNNHDQVDKSQFIAHDQEFISKNKTLGHYRESQQTLQGYDQVQEGLKKRQGYRNRLSNLPQLSIDYSKYKTNQPVDSNHAFKYIPITNLNIQLSQKNNLESKPQQAQQKTERQMPRRQFPDRTLLKKDPMPMYQQMIQERYQNSQQFSSEIHNNHPERGNLKSQQSRYRSGKDIGIKNLQGSGVKAYTEHHNYADSGDQLSVASEKHLYSQIRKLRQMTKQRGIERQIKQASNAESKQRIRDQHNPIQDYRHHQKTQRSKYFALNNYQQVQQNNYFQHEQERIIVRGQYPQQRVVRVIASSDRSLRGQVPLDRRVSDHNHSNIQYVAYVQDYQMRGHHPVYIQEPQPQYYQKHVQYISKEPRNYPIQKSYPNSQYQDAHTQNRQKSVGSVNSYKSIPYVKVQKINDHSPIEYLSKERSVEYSRQNERYYRENTNKNQY